MPQVLSHISIKRLQLQVFVSALLLCFCSCSNTRKLADGEALYTGSTVKIVDKEIKGDNKSALESELKAAIRPLPNRKFLGMRVRLRMYNFAGVPKKEKGLKNWLRNKFGEEPVLASQFSATKNVQIVNNILQNNGYFFPETEGVLKVSKKKKAEGVFTVKAGNQYRINTIDYTLKSAESIAGEIKNEERRSMLREGNPYNLETLKQERERIDTRLKEKGYYFFASDYIEFLADTTIGDYKVDFKIKLANDRIPDKAFNAYRINNTYIFSNFRLGSSSVSDTLPRNYKEYKDFRIVDRRNTFRPSLYERTMKFRKGELYSRRKQDASLMRLVSLSSLKFVKNRFEAVGDTLLDVYYYLTPAPRKNIRFEGGVLTQNDSRVGSQVGISWRHRNTFKGSEEFSFRINGGLEAQYSGANERPNIYTIGAQASLSFPYFVVPFIRTDNNSFYTPKTLLTTSYSFETQSNILRVNSYKFSFGYQWKETIEKDHQLFPVNFTYVKTDTLGTGLFNNYYGNLVFNGIILGPTYQFSYNTQAKGLKRNNFFFEGLADFSGNIMGLAQNADYSTNPKRFLGNTFAQYMKYQLDFRYMRKLGGTKMWANRLILGIGVPYGNSYELPNVKQFFSGGNSSLRGFRSRLVGPGTFNENYLYGTNDYIQTLGDLKLELNTELRLDIYKFLKLGVFVDAGNIWLMRENPNLPGGKFTSEFYRELAADAGLGLRFDFSILMLRLDLGMPIRKPWLPENDRWVFDRIDFSDKYWRRENLILNISIGYPF